MLGQECYFFLVLGLWFQKVACIWILIMSLFGYQILSSKILYIVPRQLVNEYKFLISNEFSEHTLYHWQIHSLHHTYDCIGSLQSQKWMQEMDIWDPETTGKDSWHPIEKSISIISNLCIFSKQKKKVIIQIYVPLANGESLCTVYIKRQS